MTVTNTDAQTRRDVLDELRHDVRVDATNVNVDVQNGAVHLTGMVPTYFQKMTAGADAQRIKGVRGVRNDLVVTLATPFSDQEITDTVRANLSRDVRITNPQAINLATTNGVVSLRGQVGTYDQKAGAVDDAWTAPGVVDVVDQIEVKPPVIRDDAQLATAARDALAGDPGVDSTNVKVSAMKGTVYLRGTVPTYYQVQQAANDAWSVAGTLNVVNELGVSF